MLVSRNNWLFLFITASFLNFNIGLVPGRQTLLEETGKKSSDVGTKTCNSFNSNYMCNLRCGKRRALCLIDGCFCQVEDRHTDPESSEDLVLIKGNIMASVLEPLMTQDKITQEQSIETSSEQKSSEEFVLIKGNIMKSVLEPLKITQEQPIEKSSEQKSSEEFVLIKGNIMKSVLEPLKITQEQPIEKPILRHHIAHFCPTLDVARTCIRTCMKKGKPAFCGKDHVCYCGHLYEHSNRNDTGLNLEKMYSQFHDLYTKYFGPQVYQNKHLEESNES